MAMDDLEEYEQAEFPCPKGIMFRALVEAAVELKWNLLHSDVALGRLAFKTRIVHMAWVDEVSISVVPMGHSSCSVSIDRADRRSSRSMASEGRDRDNLARLLAAVSQVLHAQGIVLTDKETKADLSAAPMSDDGGVPADEALRLLDLPDEEFHRA